MPGYMMHLCEAAYIENIILNSDKGDVDTVISRALTSVFNSPDSTNEFLLGTVLPMRCQTNPLHTSVHHGRTI